MTTSAVYPAGVAPALGHLHSSLNDIEIFVEDTANRNIWRNILKKFLPEGIAFSDPIPLGGRPRVLEECQLDQSDDGRKRLYIIDADLDILKGIPEPNLKHLYQLRAYCIENYLLQEDALVKVAQVLDTNLSEQDARNQLDFSGWKYSNEQKYRNLFICYATVNSLDEQHQTVGFWVGNLSQSRPLHDELCPVKTATRVISLYRTIRQGFSKETVREVHMRISKNSQNIDYFTYVSGKDCLLKMLLVRLKRLFGHMRDDQITVLLSDYISPDIDPDLRLKLEQICST
jgi:hypothetical protein